MSRDVRLRFCGTRGYIEESSPLHRMHSAQLIAFGGKRLLLDAGQDWAGKLGRLRPDWIAITHAHPDHAFGLAKAPDVPIYVTRETYELLSHYPVKRFRIVEPWREFRPGPFRVTPYPVIHSIRCPAVGFRVRTAGKTIVYNPDVVSIPEEARALSGVDAYIGDGATLTRPLVRARGPALFGHTTVRAQLGWCRRNGIPLAYIVHCGKQLVEMDPEELQFQVDALAGAGLRAVVTHDGMVVRI
jgi:phosphoribosyl 1,2-cyclic phosphodiesterase